MANKTVLVQNWEESERGWGVRPDGFTVHVSRVQRDKYVKWYNETYNNLSEAPDEYTRVSGDPIEVEVSDALFEKIRQAAEKTGHVDGYSSHFSATPMRELKDSDIRWK